MGKSSKNLGSKKSFYLAVLNAIKQYNSNLQKIKRNLNISKQRLNYYIRELTNRGCLNKISKGNYVVKHQDLEHAFNSTKKECRGHAFIWTIKLNKKYKWKHKLESNRVEYKLIRNLIPRIIIKNRKIWLGKKTITIYEPHSFYGRNAIESKKYAVIDLLEILEKLEMLMQVNLKPYTFKPSREHYGLIKNDLARQYNRINEKLVVRDDLEGEWLWIDDSESLAELETGGKKALTRNIQVQNWYNDLKENAFVTPSFLLKNINKNAEHLNYYAKNLDTHVEAIKTLSNAVNELRKQIKNFSRKKYK